MHGEIIKKNVRSNGRILYFDVVSSTMSGKDIAVKYDRQRVSKYLKLFLA